MKLLKKKKKTTSETYSSKKKKKGKKGQSIKLLSLKKRRSMKHLSLKKKKDNVWNLKKNNERDFFKKDNKRNFFFFSFLKNNKRGFLKKDNEWNFFKKRQWTIRYRFLCLMANQPSGFIWCQSHPSRRTAVIIVFNWNHFVMRLLNLRINFLSIADFLYSSW